MRKKLLFTTILLAFILTISAQNKKVAIMETKANDNVSAFECNVVRGCMETAVTNAPGYEGYDRTAFDYIMQEHQFERSGTVDDSQIRELGKMAGVQYILVTEAGKQAGFFYILAKILDVETGQFMKSVNDLCNATPTDIKETCDDLGLKLFGESGSIKSNENARKKTLPPNSKDVPIVHYLFDYRPATEPSNDASTKFFADFIYNLLTNNYTIEGFRIEGNIIPGESNSIGGAELVLQMIKKEIKRAGLKEKDYEFVVNAGTNWEVIYQSISKSYIADNEQILNILRNCKDDNQRATELEMMCMRFPNLERVVSGLQYVDVYVY